MGRQRDRHRVLPGDDQDAISRRVGRGSSLIGLPRQAFRALRSGVRSHGAVTAAPDRSCFGGSMRSRINGSRSRLCLFPKGYSPSTARACRLDVVAGITLAALGIPEVMGYTKIAGMPVVTGLYTILVPIAVFAILGSSRHLVVGADSATAAIMAAGLAGMAPTRSPDYVALAGMLAIVTGGFLLIARLLRLGFPRGLPVAKVLDRVPDRRRHPGRDGAGGGHVRRPGRQRAGPIGSSSRPWGRSRPRASWTTAAVSASVLVRDPRRSRSSRGRSPARSSRWSARSSVS